MGGRGGVRDKTRAVLPTMGSGPSSRRLRSVVNQYTLNDFKNVNRVLRGQDVVAFGKKESAIAAAKKTIAGMKEAFREAPGLAKSATVYRGVDADAVSGLLGKGNPVGKTYTDKAFVSTSLKKGGSFFQDKKVVLEIKLPKGTKVLQPRTSNRREREVILNAGTKLKITGKTTRQHPTQGEQIVFTARVVKARK